jgi:purine-cytosine permease-like protein
VVIAGWTTSNPTIYRAGLAFQSLNPKWKRWKVTLVTGLITSLVACFPALVMRLLDFVALYGLILMPMGAVIFMDEYVLRRLGMVTRFAERAGRRINWAAAASWLVTLVFCLVLNLSIGMEIFFLGLPGWFFASLLYLLISRFNRLQNPQTV